MGGGTNSGKDPAKARSVPFLSEVQSITALGQGGSSGLAEARNFCGRTHLLALVLADGIEPPEAGTGVWLEPAGEGVAIVSDARQLGVLTDPQAVALRGCLALDYRFTGRVTARDGQSISVLVIGEQAAAA